MGASFYGGGVANSGALDEATAERFNTHAADSTMHVTNQEKQSWNEKSKIEINIQNHSMIISE